MNTLGFAVRFAFVCAVLLFGFEASRGSAFEHWLVEDVVIRPTAVVMRGLAPADPVVAVDRHLQSPHANLHVTRGCEGVETWCLMAAAIIAYPASWRRRAIGLAVGSVLVYALSVARLALLYWDLRYWPSTWEQVHGLYSPLLPVVAIGLYFLHWSASVEPARPRPDDVPGAP